VLMQAHGGALLVEAVPSVGTRVTLEFPIGRLVGGPPVAAGHAPAPELLHGRDPLRDPDPHHDRDPPCDLQSLHDAHPLRDCHPPRNETHRTANPVAGPSAVGV